MEAGSRGDPTLLKHAPLSYRMLIALMELVPAWKNSGWVQRYRF